MVGVSKYPKENEFLLGSNATFYITKERVKLYKPPGNKVCINKNIDSVYVTDIVVVK